MRALVVAILLVAAPAFADTYFNSSEPGCEIGSLNPDYLMCDDFDDGSWFETDASNGGASHPPNDGWSGGIFRCSPPCASPCNSCNADGNHNEPNCSCDTGWPATQSHARCGGLGAGGTDCAATSGVPRNGTTGSEGKHAFPNDEQVDHIFIRFYEQPQAGIVYGHEKRLTVNRNFGDGIWFGTLHQYFGSSVLRYFAQKEIEGFKWLEQNLGNDIALKDGIGDWHYIEFELKLGTPGSHDSEYRLWIDNCGPSGTACPATPTPRAVHTDVRMQETGDTSGIGLLWFEHWALSETTGESRLDQIVVSRSFIGTMGGNPGAVEGVCAGLVGSGSTIGAAASSCE